jgi:pimeloyl-ACP methyl ester carboxylesterase
MRSGNYTIYIFEKYYFYLEKTEVVKQKLLILHGALGSKHQFEPLISKAKKYFDVYFYTFSGHAEKDFSGQYTLESLADELRTFVQKNQLEGSVIFGFSMGGYIALYTALSENLICKRIITLGTKFAWNPQSAEKEIAKLNPTLIEEKAPHFANDLQRRHKDWKKLLEKTCDLMKSLGDSPLINSQTLSSLQFPVIIARGKNDRMVSREESFQMALHKNVRFIELENTPHPIERVSVDQLIDLIRTE